MEIDKETVAPKVLEIDKETVAPKVLVPKRAFTENISINKFELLWFCTFLFFKLNFCDTVFKRLTEFNLVYANKLSKK